LLFLRTTLTPSAGRFKEASRMTPVAMIVVSSRNRSHPHRKHSASRQTESSLGENIVRADTVIEGRITVGTSPAARGVAAGRCSVGAGGRTGQGRRACGRVRV